MNEISVQEADFDVGIEIAALSADDAEAGAVASFVGLVRADKLAAKVSAGETAPAVHAMTLEHYPGMTEQALADGAEFVFLCVGNDNDVRDVVYGPDGVLAGAGRRDGERPGCWRHGYEGRGDETDDLKSIKLLISRFHTISSGIGKGITLNLGVVAWFPLSQSVRAFLAAQLWHSLQILRIK